MNKSKADKDFRIVIQKKRFLDQNSLSIAVDSPPYSFAEILFLDCHFDKVDVSDAVFSCCSFHNCLFEGFQSRKGTFSGCYFEDSRIIDSEMRRVDFYDNHFMNCTFVNVDLSLSDIFSCTFKGTTFLKSNLQLISVDNVKVWESNEWVKIPDYSIFENYVEATDMVTTIFLDYDFKVEGPPPLKCLNVHMPLGSEVLKRQKQTISLEDMAYNLGKKIVFEQHRFVGLENGPESSENTGHIIDLGNIPIHEKSIVRDMILEGVKSLKGSDMNIFFQNDT